MQPDIIFDTSAINRLETAGPASEPLMRGLESGFHVILTAMNMDELIATPDTKKRDQLLTRFKRLASRASAPKGSKISLAAQ